MLLSTRNDVIDFNLSEEVETLRTLEPSGLRFRCGLGRTPPVIADVFAMTFP